MTDEMIQAAALEANQALIAQLPLSGECQHEFSPGFRKKMKKLIFRRKHPILSKALRTAAAVVIVFLLGGGLLLTFNLEVRAEFLSWIKESSEGLVMYFSTEGAEKSSGKLRYRLTEIPEGYEEYEIDSSEDGETFVYENERGEFLTFHYLHDSTQVAFGLYTEGYQCISITVGELEGEIYLTDNEEMANAVVWKDENTLFCLDAFLDAEELLKLAETIEAYE